MTSPMSQPVRSPFLTALAQPLVLLCLERRDKVMAAELLLRQIGIRALIAFDVREALRLIEQDMPHLVVVEPKVEGGGAVALFDKVRAQAAFDSVAILAHLSRVSREELTPLAQRKFGAFLTGAIDDKAFVVTIRAQLDALQAVSPYLVRFESSQNPKSVVSAVEVGILGTIGELIAVRLPWDVPIGASLRLSSRDGTYVEAEVAWSLRVGQDFVVLLPRRHVRGGGRKWLLQSVPLATIEDALRREPRSMVLVDPDEPGRAALSMFFGAHGHSLVSLAQVAEVGEKVARLAPGSILVRVPPAHMNAEMQALGQLAPGLRDWSVLLLGTTEGPWRLVSPRSGVGTLLDVMSASMLRAGDFTSLAQGSSTPARLDIELQILGCDETGLLIRSSTPITRGSRVHLAAEPGPLSQLLPNGGLPVSLCVPDPERDRTWLLRGDLVAPGTSKLRNWERIRKLLQPDAPVNTF